MALETSKLEDEFSLHFQPTYFRKIIRSTNMLLAINKKNDCGSYTLNIGNDNLDYKITNKFITFKYKSELWIIIFISKRFPNEPK